MCKVNRDSERGFCGQTNEIRVARAALHMWEEPCISGKTGSGTVFFCGCNLGCVYCQNGSISKGGTAGKIISVERLAEIYLELEAKGAANINLVTPTMFALSAADAVTKARKSGLKVPIVYNSSGYERCEIIDEVSDRIDIFLPDFKYISSEIAAKYSFAADYPKFASKAIAEMVKNTGEAVFDDGGMMKKGVIIRHLLLPGQLRESIKVIDYLFSEYGNSVKYSLMSQYTPPKFPDCFKYPELTRRVTTYEYNKLIDHALSIGVKNAYIQDGRSARESFIPEFNCEGI